MYHPYFRGKQYELLTIRELAPLLTTAGFCPIIEPVKEGLGKGPSGLEKALKPIAELGGRAIVVVNPHHGELSGTEALTAMLTSAFDLPGISAGILLTPNMTLIAALSVVIEKKNKWYVATCPELRVSSQGRTFHEAESMVQEAVGLLLEEADEDEINRRLNRGVKVKRLEVGACLHCG